ncbi:MAG: hypothetical protein NVSMB5_20910 [Candidatus Velthaea sp.]
MTLTGTVAVIPLPPVTTTLVVPARIEATVIVLPDTLVIAEPGSPPDVLAMKAPP